MPSGWAQRFPASAPSAREWFSIATDPIAAITVLFGGQTLAGAKLGDTWVWDGTSWTEMLPASSPSARSHHASCYDHSGGSRVLLYGGVEAGPSYPTDTWDWAADFTNPTDPTASDWIDLSPPTNPGPKVAHGLVTESTFGNEMLFGGLDSIGGTPSDETWRWNSADWTLLTPATSPSARAYHLLAGPIFNSQVLLFSGDNGVADTWTWDGTNWTLESPATSPAARQGAVSAVLTEMNAILMFGGIKAGDSVPTDEVWLWDGTDWTEIIALGPSARVGAGAASDPLGTGAIMFGGEDSTPETLSDTWFFLGEESGPSLRYDTLGTAVRLPDFNRLTPGVWGTKEAIFWDPSVNLGTGSTWMVDACWHNGFLTVAWLEFDTANSARGPFVSYWDGGSWNDLGGELEPSLYPVNPFPYNALDASSFNGTGKHWPDGSRFVPRDPRIASDGEHLYVAYSLHEAELVPDLPFNPPAFYWSPRHIVVQQWDGASWTLFGETIPHPFNSEKTFSESQQTEPKFGYIRIAASPAEPGRCYVLTQADTGYWPKDLAYAYFHYPGGNEFNTRSMVARMTASTLVEKNIYECSIYSFPGGPSWGATCHRPGTVYDVRNDFGLPLMNSDSDPVAGILVQNLQRWDTLGVLANLFHTATPDSYTGGGAFLTPDVDRDVYYLESRLTDGSGVPLPYKYLIEIANDGVGGWGHLDGLAPIPIQDPSGATPPVSFSGPGCPEERNIWFVTWNPNDFVAQPGDPDNRPSLNEIWQYHRNCRGWRLAYRDAVLGDYAMGASTLLLKDDDLFLITGVIEPGTGPTRYLKPRVYQIPICRNCLTCEGPETPVLNLYLHPRTVG